MKKKWMIAGSAIGISSVVMLTTGFSALAGTSGYNDYKDALKLTKALKSVSIQATAVLQDNGNTLNDAQGNLKVDLQNETASGNIKVIGKSGEQSVNLYSQQDGEAWKSGDSDTYFVKQDKPEKDDQDPSEEGDSAWMNQQAETVIDALVGNLKEYVTVDNQSDGSKQISLQLDNAQIPAVIQALAPMAFKQLSGEKDQEDKSNSATEQKDPEDLFKKSLFDMKDLQLTQDIQINNIDLNAVIDPTNYIENQKVSVTFTGKTIEGTQHTVTLNLDVHLSGFNQTTPDSVDLTGKQVQQIKDDHGGRNHEED
jgi:hypothetical protein